MWDGAVDRLDDPRVRPYLNLPDENKRVASPIFIAEGENVVLRLLSSEFVCESVLCTERKADRVRPHLPVGTELLVASEAVVHGIVGFKFHSGVIAVGKRRPMWTIDQLLKDVANHSADGCSSIGRSSSITVGQVGQPGVEEKPAAMSTVNLLVCPEITDSANLGALIRVAAGFGAMAVVLGPRCRDPMTRQTIRTSMGTIFRQPLVQSLDIARDVQRLLDEGFMTVAAVLDRDASDLREVKPSARNAILIGNEGPGLELELAEACQRKVTIPMSRQTDSLNVATAAAVLLYHFSI